MIIKDIKTKLKLKNEGQLELVFIGSGGAFSQSLFNNNFFIIKGDTHILVDFGRTWPEALSKSGVKMEDIRTVLPTHSHADHIGGMEYLALYHRYISQHLHKAPKLKMIITQEYEKILWGMSLRGGLEWNETNAIGKKLSFNDYFETIRLDYINHTPREILQINYGGILIELFRTNHIPDTARTQRQAFLSYGLYLDNRVFISGDTKFDKKLIDMYTDKSEFMFHDASFTPNPVHTSIKELSSLSPETKKKMYLMHFQDNWKDKDVSDFAGLVLPLKRYIF